MTSFYELFIEPVLRNGWFNPVNTTVYAVILVIAVYLVYRLLMKMKIGIDRHFFLAVLPFIFWGSSTRVLHDAAFYGVLTGPLGEFYSMPIFPTPGSYLITFMLALLVLLLSLAVQRFLRFSYYKIMFGIGVVLCAVNAWLLPVSNYFPLLLIGGVTLLWAALFYGARFLGKGARNLLSHGNIGILSSHMLDATATVTALSLFGYVEQHVVPRFLFPYIGAFAMFFLKILVVLPVLWLIDRYGEKGNFNNFLKLVVLILGLAPGLRDLIRLMVGV